DTIESLAGSDYPPEKLRIVTIDDGSSDDTWMWMNKARQAFSRRVVAVRSPTNRGKRHALYEGFSRARGSVLVTVDGDSAVLPDTLRNLVSPFVLDPRIGAVAGNVRVLNRDQGLLARMLDVAFTHAFEFMRASESEVDTVQCGPGALSAYRRSLVCSFQDRWLAQRFMGRPANIGEDRAMTNFVLRQGFIVRFQSNAVVLTEVPTRLDPLSRMFLRWARSNVRETLVLARFVFTRFRPESRLGARINLTWSVMQLLGGAGMFGVAVVAIALYPTTALWAVAGALLSGLFPAAIYVCSRASRGTVLRECGAALWAFPYGVLSLLALSWIGPYALLTAHRSGWLTRGLDRAPIAELPSRRIRRSSITTPLRVAR
ncbi:MAG: glycosyltransferase family 2 protein, partial [Deltaproteobacteria bacterium]|nr:glycosyltransferase family 2 protein [Deltaproteobacteria bacterium]